MTEKAASVLVVDDERGLADLFSAWLADEYEVRTAYGGEDALDIVDSSTDVVLLDRRMPDIHGDEVLEEIRSREIPCSVAMVTAVEPDYDIVEMGFDDYAVKPLERDDIYDVVERMLAFDDLGPGAKQYYAKRSKKTALESQKDSYELEENEDYEKLNDGIKVYGGMITSLAEEAIKDNKRDLLSGDQPGKKVELSKWEGKLESLDPDDPLYQVAKQRVGELESDMGGGGQGGQNKFLEAVSEGFIAEGHWMDSAVRRALNLLLYNKDDEKFIINRQALSDLAQEGASEKFEISQEVRDLARNKLAKRS